MVEFQYIIEEFLKLKPTYQRVIIDICKRMGAGMAEFRDPERKVDTIDDYNLYCHYVAVKENTVYVKYFNSCLWQGLVGIGLTLLFINSGIVSHPKLILSNEMDTIKPVNKDVVHESEYLANRMGLFLQKINIIKDFSTDLQEGRVFWPAEIWKQYVPAGEGLQYLASHRDRALACLNHLCADALELVPDTLEYMSLLEEESVFKFCAIPQVRSNLYILIFFLFKGDGNSLGYSFFQ